MWGGVAGVLAVLGLWIVAPKALRRLEFFRVRQIELVGVRHLAPDAVIGALRLRSRARLSDWMPP